MTGAVESLLRDHLDDPSCAWSLGSYGAIAEFMRDADEPAAAPEGERLGWATARGAIALTPSPDLVPVAYETGFASGWSQTVALCLPREACAMGRRSVVTECGPDADAARAEDRAALLFDLGLGLAAVDACVRSADPEVIACLRAGAGRPLLEPGNPIGPNLVAMSPHRVFRARIGRIEVFSPIPAADAASPEGPHTHVLPTLLRSGRTHAATAPIPAGLVPCAALHPPHPCKDGMGRPIPYDSRRHDAFGQILDAWGDPALVALRRAVLAAHAPEPPAGRFARSAVRAAEAQLRAARGGAG